MEGDSTGDRRERLSFGGIPKGPRPTVYEYRSYGEPAANRLRYRLRPQLSNQTRVCYFRTTPDSALPLVEGLHETKSVRLSSGQ